MWNVQLLGGLVLRGSDRVVTRFRYHKAGSLLAYLAYFNEANSPPRSREVLIDMLWPDAELETGQKNLRNVLSTLRPVLEPPGIPPGSILSADRFNVSLNPTAVFCDVHRFELAAREALREEAGDPDYVDSLIRAADLYGGPLLPGYFEDWISQEALRLSTLFVELARRAVPALRDCGRLEEALKVAQKAIAADPYSEDAIWTLMRVLADQDQTSQALKAYRQFERKLQEEWQEIPTQAIRTYARELRLNPPVSPIRSHVDRGAYVSPGGTQSASTDGEISNVLTEPLETSANEKRFLGSAFTVLTNTRFFGRETEIARLIRMLSAPRTRLITIVGPGGIGKTRLAVETVTRHFAVTSTVPRTAVFVALGEVTDASRICETILRSMGKLPVEGVDPLEQVTVALAAQESLLLVLDNFEQLAEAGASTVGELLAQVPKLQCLVTSRQKLLLEGENEFRLSPLSSTGSAETPEALQNLPSVALFVDRAQMVRPDFQVTPHNAAALAELCNHLEGMPLAIELAAARVQLLPVARILEQIRMNRLDFLANRRRDATCRQRTLRSTLDWSYRLLSEPARELLVDVSVFRGGWTLEAAEAVSGLSAEDTLQLLGELRDNSLLQVVDDDEGLRFAVLETVREYAAEQLQKGGREEEIRRRHLMFFLAMAEKEEAGLAGPDEAAILRKIGREQANFRSAVDWARAAGEVVLRARIGVALFNFWTMLGYVAELRGWLLDLRDDGSDNIPPSLRAKVLYVLGRCARIRGDTGEVSGLYQRSLSLFEEAGDVVGTAWVLLYMGIHQINSELPESCGLIESSLTLMRTVQDEPGIALCLVSLTRVVRSKGQASNEKRERVRAWCREAREICGRRGDLHGLADVLAEDGHIARSVGDLQSAMNCFEEALALRRRIGDRPGMARVLNLLGVVSRDALDLVQSKSYLEESIDVFRDCQWDKSNSAAQALLDLAKTYGCLGAESEAEAVAKRSLELYHRRGERSGFYRCLQFLVQLATPCSHPELMARLIGAAEAIRGTHHAVLDVRDQHGLEKTKATLRNSLGDFRYAQEEGAGRLLTEEAAVALALATEYRYEIDQH